MILILYSIFLKKISSIISWCLIANIPSVNIEHKKMLADVKILNYLKTVSVFTIVASSTSILLTIMQSLVISYFIIRIKKITFKEEEETKHTEIV